MKQRWGQVINGIVSWLAKMKDKEVLVSIFTYDTSVHMGPLYKTPSELTEILNKGIEASGNENVSLGAAIEALGKVINAEEGISKGALNWLHYAILVTGEDSNYPDKQLGEFLEFKKKNGINFFFNAVSQIERTFEMTKLATTLEGVHYSVRRGSDFGKAISEALERDPHVSR